MGGLNPLYPGPSTAIHLASHFICMYVIRIKGIYRTLWDNEKLFIFTWHVYYDFACAYFSHCLSPLLLYPDCCFAVVCIYILSISTIILNYNCKLLSIAGDVNLTILHICIFFILIVISTGVHVSPNFMSICLECF